MGRLYDKFINLLVDKKLYNETWYFYLTGHWHTPFPDELKSWRSFINSQRKFYSFLPSDPHCHECGIPMAGFGGNALRFMGSAPSSFSPKLCSACEKKARQYEVGAELQLTMNRFYKETRRVLI